MLVTPLQMAEVVATVANGGTLMKPTFLQQVTDPDGRVTDELDPEEQSEVISEESAQQLTEMMLNVTEDPRARRPASRSPARASPARPAPPRSTRPRGSTRSGS